MKTASNTIPQRTIGGRKKEEKKRQFAHMAIRWQHIHTAIATYPGCWRFLLDYFICITLEKKNSDILS